MKKAQLFYDGKCPFCNQYSKFKELQECIDLELHDARENLSWQEFNSRIKLDDGIILIIAKEKTLLQGVEAIAYLENVCKFKGLFFKLQKFIFSNKILGALIYSILKALRKIALFFKG